MSWTKNYYHEQICALMAHDEDEEQWYFYQETQDETQIDWFPEYRLDFRGYEEIAQPVETVLSDEDLPF